MIRHFATGHNVFRNQGPSSALATHGSPHANIISVNIMHVSLRSTDVNASESRPRKMLVSTQTRDRIATMDKGLVTIAMVVECQWNVVAFQVRAMPERYSRGSRLFLVSSW